MTAISLYSNKPVTSKRKDLIFMGSKTQGINVRVTLAEKEKLSESAFYCGLSLSEYLRRLELAGKGFVLSPLYCFFRQSGNLTGFYMLNRLPMCCEASHKFIGSASLCLAF